MSGVKTEYEVEEIFINQLEKPDETDGIRRIPYYRFIYDNSVSRDRKIIER